METQWDYQLNQERFRMKFIDVQCQSSGIQRWSHCFEGSIAAVLYVASLSCYDEWIYDGDRKMNAMSYQLELFDKCVNRRLTWKSEVILFLNKQDLFAEKIKRVPLTKCQSFASYDDKANDLHQSTKYICKAFTARDSNQNRLVIAHVTCATDADNISRVFDDVAERVIRGDYRRGGLIL